MPDNDVHAYVRIEREWPGDGVLSNRDDSLKQITKNEYRIFLTLFAFFLTLKDSSILAKKILGESLSLEAFLKPEKSIYMNRNRPLTLSC